MGLFDLHVHTSFLSEDAHLEPLEAVKRLEALGFSGLAFTEHNAVWPEAAIQFLRRQTSLILVAGMELEVEEVGHVIVLGWDDEPIWRYHRLERLMEAVRRKGAIAGVAHPFRPWFPLWANQNRQAVSEERAQRLFTQWASIGCLEVYNGKMGPQGNRAARRLWGDTGWNFTAGSDAHRWEQLGTTGVILPSSVHSPADVIHAVRCRNQLAVWRPCED